MRQLSTAFSILVAVSLMPMLFRMIGQESRLGRWVDLPLNNEMPQPLIPYSPYGATATQIAVMELRDEQTSRFQTNRIIQSQEDRMAFLAGSILAGAWLVSTALRNTRTKADSPPQRRAGAGAVPSQG